MTPLDDRRRKQLGGLSALLCSIAILLLPVAARSSIGVEHDRLALEERFRLPVLAPAYAPPHLIVLRDPFDSVAPPPEEMSYSGSPFGTSRPQLVPLPPNRGAMGTSVADAAGVMDVPIVRAVITGGATPRALVDENGQVRIIGLSDTMEGSPVVAIDTLGIRLKNGVRFAVSEENQ